MNVPLYALRPAPFALRLPPCAVRFALPALLLGSWMAIAQPVLVSVVPGRAEMGVSPTTTIRFSFNTAMNTSATAATVMVVQGANFYTATTTPAWSDGDKVLTCTPSAPFPAGSVVTWSLDGEDTMGIQLDSDYDFFMVGGSSDLGCDPLVPMYSFTVSKGWVYQQSSPSAPALDIDTPHCFLACSTIPCPNAPTNISLRLPSGLTENLTGTPNPGHPQLLDCSHSTPAALDAAYGTGNYLFTVQATSSNMPVTVNFPTFTQPSAPHVSNWDDAQAIDPTQPFTLTWDAMTGGTAADCIYVEIYGGSFKTPALGDAGALNGTATSVTIPANTLQPNQTYQGSVTFYHYQMLTNGTSYVTLAYRASTTEFELNTTAGTGSSLVIHNAAAVTATGKFTFDVSCLPNDLVIIERSTTLLPNSWSPIYLTNATTSVVRITDDLAPGHSFYRARKGP